MNACSGRGDLSDYGGCGCGGSVVVIILI